MEQATPQGAEGCLWTSTAAERVIGVSLLPFRSKVEECAFRRGTKVLATSQPPASQPGDVA